MLTPCRQQLNIDLQFDCFIGQHVRSFLAHTKAGKETLVTDLHVSSLQLNFLQSVADMHEHADQESTSSHHCRSLLVATHVIVNNLCLKSSRATGSDMPQSQGLALEFGGLACAVDSAGCMEIPWHFLAGPSKFSIDDRNIQLSLGSIFTDTQQHAPEHFVPTVQTAIRLASGLRSSFATYAGYSRSADQNLVLKVIKLAGNRVVVDPLSTTQPSYLIQSGRPHELRTDIGFKFLVFLRQYLERCGQDQRQLLLEAFVHRVPETSVDGMLDLVHDYLPQFGADMESFTFPHGSPLEFLVASPEQDKANSPPIESVSLALHGIHALYSSPDSNDSEVLLASAVVNARVRATEWSEPHLGAAHKSSTAVTLVEKMGQGMRHVSVIISLGDVAISFYPSLIAFAQHVIQVTKRTGLFAKPSVSQSSPTSFVSSPALDSNTRPPVTYVDFILSSNSFKIKAGAQNLVIEYRASGVDFSCTSLMKPATPKSALELAMNHSLMFKEARLQGCALADMSKPEDYAVLAALILPGGKLNALVRYQTDVDPQIRLALGLGGLQLNVPRSAIRLYRFAQEWREDYLPGIKETFKSLLVELKPDSGSSDTQPATSPQSRPLASWLPRNAEIIIGSFRVSLQVMRGTWVAWELGGIIAYMAGVTSQRGSKQRTFGLQISYHTFIISAKSKTTDPTPSVRLKLPLPTFTATGLYDGVRLEGLVLIETFTVNIKPSHWDTLLTVQQKFGQDFSDLVSLIEDSRPRRPEGKKDNRSSSSLQYRLQGKMKGLSIALEAGSSAILLECERIGGAILQSGSGISGHLELSDLALSLAPRSDPSSPVPSFDRSRRSAFVIIDLLVEMGEPKEHSSQVANLAVTKIHAVMQPSSIGQIGDFLDHLQVRHTH
jgi:hypothetical protein